MIVGRGGPQWVKITYTDRLHATERRKSDGSTPRWADIAGDFRYLLVRASWGHRSCLGYDGRCGEVSNG